MFTRNNQDSKPAANEPRPFDALKLASTNGAAEARSTPPPVQTGSSSQARSIIGNDLTIVGQGLRIISQGILQVDGDVTGDVVGSEVIIGEKGRVTGVVSGESVVVRGEVAGTIRGLRVVLQSGAKVEGDVGGSEVIIGEKGKVTGTVAAERVIVRGQILGVIRGMTVTLQASSRVEGDIHHLSLAIEQGAEFDGRCRRPSDANELNLNLELGSSGAPKPN
jgi:cytoskeletal protein CcmA (bactofilin family)